MFNEYKEFNIRYILELFQNITLGSSGVEQWTVIVKYIYPFVVCSIHTRERKYIEHRHLF